MFHLHAGVRLALRALVPILLPFIVAVGLSPSPSAFLGAIALSTATPATDPTIQMIVAALSIGVAVWASPRLTHGLDGWIRHLPASGPDHRRAAAVGLAAAQAPVLLLIAILAAGVLLTGAAELSSAKIAGLPVLALGSAYAALPVRRRLAAAPPALAAALLSVAGEWTFLIAGFALLAAAEALAGPLRAARRTRRLRRVRVLPLGVLISWRAVRHRSAGALVAGLVPVGFGALFVANNRLSGAHAAMAVRLAALLGASAALAFLAQSLAVRRPAWAWARSLPGSSGSRIRGDALFLGLHALAVVAAASWIDPWGAVAAAAATPVLSLRAASAIRSGLADRPGALWRILADGLVASCVLAVSGWSAWIAMALVPAAHRSAVRSEEALKVTRFLDLHHRAAGDPLSWSA